MKALISNLNNSNVLLKGLMLMLFFTVSSCLITIRRPKELAGNFENGQIKTTYANFGFNPYGYTISGLLHYAPNNEVADLACKLEELQKAVDFSPPDSLNKNQYDHVPILMIDRGDCHFVTKVRNVQSVGAKAAIIVDNTNENLDDLIMGDDGTGSDITIPAVLISQKDGQKIEEYYKKKQSIDAKGAKIYVDIDFQVEQANNRVTLDVFMTSTDSEIYTILIDMLNRGYAENIGKI